MLYHLFLWLHDTTPWLGALNVTRHGLGTGRLDSISGLVERVRLVPAGSRPQERTTPDELAERAAER